MSHRGLERYTAVCLFADLVGVATALALAALLRLTLPAGRALDPRQDYVTVLLFPLVLCCWALAAGHFRLYEWHWLLNLRSEFARLGLSIGGALMLIAGALYLTYRDVPRLLFFYFALLTLILLSISRVLIRALFRSRLGGISPVRIALAGGGRMAESLAKRLVAERNRWPPIDVVGYLGDRGDSSGGLPPYLGALGEIEAVIRRETITTVVVTLPSAMHAETLKLTERLRETDVDVRVVPDVLDLAYARATITNVEGIPLVGLRDPALSPGGRIVKYSFDRIVSLVGLALASPLFATIALLVRLDAPGPVFYRARRIGEDGRPFIMYKFRTMENDADSRHPALGANVSLDDLKPRSDPRVTRIGRLLRRTSLDELPQLWNVLRGEMSLVGPRPEQTFIVERYEPWQHRRTHIRPGMTGWWQVNGRGERPMHQHTEYDLYYLENYSLLLDLRILGRTVGAVLRGRGAF